MCLVELKTEGIRVLSSWRLKEPTEGSSEIRVCLLGDSEVKTSEVGWCRLQGSEVCKVGKPQGTMRCTPQGLGGQRNEPHTIAIRILVR